MRKILESCPNCGGPLTITEVRCDGCATEVRSRFQPCPFCRLSPEQTNFVLMFVQNRGNLRDMEKALGVSYPTIRGKLEEIIKVISAAPMPTAAPTPESAAPAPPATNPERDWRRDVLNQVAGGKLSAADALIALRGGEKHDD